jgi:hypothetical protein
VQRRKYLATIGSVSVALAGCTGGGDGGTGGGSGDGSSSGGDGSSGGSEPTETETETPTETPTPTPQEVINDTRQIPEDEFYRWSFEANVPLRLDIEFTVREGPKIDFLVMSGSEYQEYDDGNRFRTMIDATGTVGDTISGTVEEGPVYIVADNTNRGPTDPPSNFDDDIAEVEVFATVEPA